jgi:glycosyltransferase involved in cell wall biosynthesis
MHPLVSVIIPCYNSGKFLPEALESLVTIPTEIPYEIIIVDDGSTDPTTLELLSELSIDKYKVLHQPNKGPASARNEGVRASKGEFLLFLDSDNRIKGDYVSKGVAIFEVDPTIGVVYGNPLFFGDYTEIRFVPKAFDMYSLLIENYIDMCSLVRRNVWNSVGGLDENKLIIGHEDWEFWIRIGAHGFGFYHLNDIMFEYRIRNDSLIKQASAKENYSHMLNYVHTKHGNIYAQYYKILSRRIHHYQSNPFRTFIKAIYNKYR